MAQNGSKSDEQIREELMKIAKNIDKPTIIPDPWHEGDEKWKVELEPYWGNGKKAVEVWEFRQYTEDDVACARETGLDLTYLSLAHKVLKDVFIFDDKQQ